MKKLLLFLLGIGILLNQMIPVYADYENITIYSDYYYMMDLDNGQVILDSGSTDQIYPASLTKMMTLIVALENIEDSSETVVLDRDVWAGLYEENASLAGFSLNERVTLEDCLYGLFLPSGAETTRAIAFYVAGSEEAFVNLMNQKAQELGMEHTHYVNTTGLHENEHYTTLQDLSLLIQYCIQNEKFLKIFSTKNYVAKSGSFHSGGISWQSSTFKNLEKVGFESVDETWILGGKTGYTIPAGLCLATIAIKENRRYLLITAHAPSGSTPYHAMDAMAIYDEILNHTSKTVLVQPEDILNEAKVRFNFLNKTVELHSEKEIELTLPEKTELDKIETVLEVEDSYDAPIQEGEILGTASLVYKGEEIYQFNVVANKTLDRNPVLYGIYRLQGWIIENLVLTGFILFVLGFILWRVLLHRYEIKDKLRTRRKKSSKWKIN